MIKSYCYLQPKRNIGWFHFTNLFFSVGMRHRMGCVVSCRYGNGMCRIASDTNMRIGANLKKHDVSSRFNVSSYRIQRVGGSVCRIVQLRIRLQKMPLKKSWTTINNASDILSTRSKLSSSITSMYSIFQYVPLGEDLLVRPLDSTQLDLSYILQSRPRMYQIQ